MKKLILLFVSLFVTVNVQAAGLPEPGKTWIADSIKLNALMDSYAGYGLYGRPNSTNLATGPQNKFRYNDRGANQFVLNQGQIGFSHRADPVGFELAFWAGSQADTSAVSNAAVDRGHALIRKANVTWQEKDSWGFSFGKWDSGIGFESTDSVHNWNYGRSLQFANLQPNYFMGAKVMFPVSAYNLNLIVANGASRHLDNNSAKALGATFGGGEVNAWQVAYVYSPEQDNNSVHPRHTANFVMKHMWSEKNGVAVDGTYAQGKKELVSTAGSRANATRYGAALYWLGSMMQNTTQSIRGEYLRDVHGAVTLTKNRTSFYTGTLTHRWMATRNMSLWLEGRFDHASTATFIDRHNNGKSNQATATLAATLEL